MEESVKDSVHNVLESVKKYVNKSPNEKSQDSEKVSETSLGDKSRQAAADESGGEQQPFTLEEALSKDLASLEQNAQTDDEAQIYHAAVTSVVRSSHQMLSYAACAGKEVGLDISKTITEFSHKVINGEGWSAADETKFLGASGQLAKSLSPVTYDTLHSSTNKRADKFVKLFGILTVTLLLFLVAAQSFWVLINNATQTIDVKQNDMLTASMNIESFAKQNAVLNDQLLALSSKKTDRTTVEERSQILKAEILKNEDAIGLSTRKYNQAEDLLNSSARILAYWLPFQSSIKPGDQDGSFKNTLLATWAKQILQGMSAYLLPLIYGLVGACAFVLRALSRQIRERTFSTTDSVIQFGLRLVLGALAGISIGWFLKPEVAGDNMVASLSPLALAFIAGYSVELVFTAIDKIISAFTGSGPGESKASTAN